MDDLKQGLSHSTSAVLAIGALPGGGSPSLPALMNLGLIASAEIARLEADWDARSVPAEKREVPALLPAVVRYLTMFVSDRPHELQAVYNLKIELETLRMRLRELGDPLGEKENFPDLQPLDVDGALAESDPMRKLALEAVLDPGSVYDTLSPLYSNFMDESSEASLEEESDTDPDSSTLSETDDTQGNPSP